MQGLWPHCAVQRPCSHLHFGGRVDPDSLPGTRPRAQVFSEPRHLQNPRIHLGCLIEETLNSSADTRKNFLLLGKKPEFTSRTKMGPGVRALSSLIECCICKPGDWQPCP
ncbi:ubiquitin-like protein 3 isoform X5 [Phacochoerus africanus]|uniref:ubiquitin-like protein 3 isoform X5 n=1 Tax=Phacochoerus africanus TaxID=41426 RepID=UPI001FDA9837|nr:ubiquitin-like protein 3 isoform X5 [Phacochoerus africanus]